MSARPPVIILGIDSPIGLAAVRELGAAGVEVHGIARSSRGLGLWSRHLARGYVRAADDDALVPQLLDIARTSGASLLMTVSMSDSLRVREAAASGRLPGLRPLLADQSRLALVNDKAAVCAVAERLGIPVPRTWEPRAANEPPPAGFTFPVILKWRDPEAAGPVLERLGLDLLKSELAKDEAELRAALSRYRSAGIYPLVQSYCPGTGLGQMFLMKDGRALMRFQHRRLHEWPPEGGVSTLCESLPPGEHPALMERSEALLREIGWEGPAMVEYRHDEATGAAALMEINGRFWGSLPLASAAGAHFALGTYLALGLDESAGERDYRVGLRCRYFVPETRRLIRILFAPSKIADPCRRFSRTREILRYGAGFFGSTHYVFRVSDPLPFFADLVFMAREAAHSAISKLRRSHDERTPLPEATI